MSDLENPKTPKVPASHDSADSFKSVLEADIDNEEVADVENLKEAELLQEDEYSDQPIDEYSDIPNEDLFNLMKGDSKSPVIESKEPTEIENSNSSDSPEEIEEIKDTDENETDLEDNPLLIDESRNDSDEKSITPEKVQDDSSDPLDLPPKTESEMLQQVRMALGTNKILPVKDKDDFSGGEFKVGKTVIKKLTLSNLPKKELSEISNPDIVSYIRRNINVGNNKGDVKTILVKKKGGGFEIVKFPETREPASSGKVVVVPNKESYMIKKISPVPGLVKKTINLPGTSASQTMFESFNLNKKYRLVRKQDEISKINMNEIDKRPDYQFQLAELKKPSKSVEFPKAIFYPKKAPSATVTSSNQSQLQIGSVTSLAPSEKFISSKLQTSANKPRFIELSMENLKKLQSDITIKNIDKSSLESSAAQSKFLVKSVGKFVPNPENFKVVPNFSMPSTSGSKTYRIVKQKSVEDQQNPSTSKKIIINPPHYREKSPIPSNIIYKNAVPPSLPSTLEIAEVHGNYRDKNLEPPQIKKIAYMIPQNLFGKSVGPPKNKTSTVESLPEKESQAMKSEASTSDQAPQQKRRRKEILVPLSGEIEFEDPYIPPPRPEVNTHLMEKLAYYRTISRVLMQRCLKVNYNFDFNDDSKNYIKTYNYNRDKPVFQKYK